MPILEKLITAAEHHAVDTGEAHDIGDLESMLRAAWEILTPAQRRSFLKSEAVGEVVEHGARGAFEVSELVNEVPLPAPAEGALRMIVVGKDSTGAPAIFTLEQAVTEAQVANGEHYDLAMDAADEQGYEGPYVAIDNTDPAALQLLSANDWLNA